MTVDNDKVKDKIRKLLTLANDPGAFEGEVNNALRFARRLMVEHNIKESDVNKPQDKKNPEDFEYQQVNVYSFGRDLTKWESTLMCAIVELVGTIQHYRTNQKVPKRNDHGGVEKGPRGEERTVTKMVFYGPTADARDSADLFNEWVHIIVTVARMKFGSYVRGGARSYCEGFAYGLYVQVTAIKKEEKTENTQGTGRALAIVNANQLMDAKKRYALEWLKKEQNVTLKKTRAHKNRGDDPDAFRNGVEDGKKTQFTREQVQKVGNI